MMATKPRNIHRLVRQVLSPPKTIFRRTPGHRRPPGRPSKTTNREIPMGPGLRWAHRRPAARWWAVQLRASCALDARSTVAAHALRLPGAFSPARMLPCRAVSPSSRPSECLERAKIMGTSNVHVDDVLYSHACSVTPAHPSVSTSRERANPDLSATQRGVKYQRREPEP